jgi:hypothetical protein
MAITIKSPPKFDISIIIRREKTCRIFEKIIKKGGGISKQLAKKK